MPNQYDSLSQGDTPRYGSGFSSDAPDLTPPSGVSNMFDSSSRSQSSSSFGNSDFSNSGFNNGSSFNSYDGNVQDIQSQLDGLSSAGKLFDTKNLPEGTLVENYDPDVSTTGVSIPLTLANAAGSGMILAGHVYGGRALENMGRKSVTATENMQILARQNHTKATQHLPAGVAEVIADSQKKAAYRNIAANKLGQNIKDHRYTRAVAGAGKAIYSGATKVPFVGKPIALAGNVASFGSKLGKSALSKAVFSANKHLPAAVRPALGRLGIRGLTAAAFPVGTAIAVGTIIADPMIVNGISNVIQAFNSATTPKMDTPPSRPELQYLTLCNDGNRDPAIREVDAELVTANDTSFDYEPDDVWPERPNIESTSTFENYGKAINDITNLIVDAAESSFRPLQQYGQEPLISRLIDNRTKFLDAMTAMPGDYLSKIADESMYPIAGFMNAYQTFHNLVIRSREGIATSDQTDTVFFGMIGNPLDAIMPNKLSVDEMANVALEMRKAADEIDQGNTRLANTSRLWSFDSSSIQPVFASGALQSAAHQYEQKTQEEEAKDKGEDKKDNGLPGIPTGPSSPSSFVPGGSRSPANGGWSPSPVSPFSSSSPGGSGGFNPPKLDTPKLDTSRVDAEVLETPKIDNPNSFVAPKPIGRDDAESAFTPNSPDLPDIDTNDPFDDSKLKDKPDEFANSSDDVKTDMSFVKPVDNVDARPLNAPIKPSVNPVDMRSPLNTNNITDGVRNPTAPSVTPPASPTPKAPSAPNTPPAPKPQANISMPKAPSAGPGNATPASVPGGENKLNSPLGGDKPAAPKDPAAGGSGDDNHNVEAPEFENDGNNGERETTSISRDGKTFDMGDSRSAKLAELINPTDGKPSMSLRDAMAEAGYAVPDPGADLGERISPVDLKPGDLIVGENGEGVYVGDGQVLTKDGLKPLAEFAIFTGDGHGMFRPGGVDIDADAGATGQKASAAEDLASGNESKSKLNGSGSKSGLGGAMGPGLAGLGNSSANRAMTDAGRKASVTPKGDPFDPGNSVSSDPFEKISVTGANGVGRGFSANVPTGD